MQKCNKCTKKYCEKAPMWAKTCDWCGFICVPCNIEKEMVIWNLKLSGGLLCNICQDCLVKPNRDRIVCAKKENCTIKGCKLNFPLEIRFNKESLFGCANCKKTFLKLPFERGTREFWIKTD